MKLKDWYRKYHRHNEVMDIAAYFIDDWNTRKPQQVDCAACQLYWYEYFGECDVVREEHGETQCTDVRLDGRAERSYTIKYHHAWIDGDQANIARGRTPPEPKPRKKPAASAKGRKRKPKRFTL